MTTELTQCPDCGEPSNNGRTCRLCDSEDALHKALTQRPAAQEVDSPIAASLGDIVALWDQHAPSEYMTAIHMQAKRALAGQQPVSPDLARWCAYVGGMVAHWVKSEPDALARLGDDAFEAAIAGIIERRLWAMPKTAPQQATPDLADGPARMHWTNWMPVKDALEYAYAKMGLEMVKTDAGSKYPNLHWNLAGLVREFVVAQQDAMFGKCQACGKNVGLLDQIKCLDCGTRLCEPCAKEHFGSDHGARAAASHSHPAPTTSGWVETSAPPQCLDWSDTQQATPEPAGWTDADADAARLAMELECLLLDTKDTAAVSRWWKSANEALDLHRARLAAAQAKGGVHE